jgi:hypothetical protein
VARRFFRDPHGDPSTSIIVAGVARSGTTWVAEVLRSQHPLRIMFEPFHARHVPGFREFPFHLYKRPEEVDERLERFTGDILSGRIRDPRWIDRYVDCLFPRFRVIKDVRISLFLRWIHRWFPEVPILFVIRHPCAVAASHLRLGWSTEEDVRSMLKQPELLEDFLLPFSDLLQTRTKPHERHAALWCVSNLVVLNQFRGQGYCALYYEDLVDRPKEVIPKVFEVLGRGYGSSVFDFLSRPSLTTDRGSAILSDRGSRRPWEDHMTAQQADEVMEVVRAFGLDHLYDPSGDPSGVISWKGDSHGST